MNIPQRLAELNLTLPSISPPIAAYVPVVRTGSLLFISGQLPMRDGALLAVGPVPSRVSIEAAVAAARQCTLNALAAVGSELGGDWSRLVRAVRVGVFVLSDPGFDAQAKVANGASELLQALLGEAGRHARAAVGAGALPLGASVEIEFIFEAR
jgi:enamine deaminase RidA (YjgF/YER057c/UK114 family)